MSSGIEYADDRIMCCLCFGGFYKNELWKDAHGVYWDICKQCQAEEFRRGLQKVKHTIMNYDDQNSPLVKYLLEDLKPFGDEI